MKRYRGQIQAISQKISPPQPALSKPADHHAKTNHIHGLITALLLNSVAAIAAVGASASKITNDYFRRELLALNALAEAGLVELDEHWITVTPRGRMLVRNVCMVFDAYLSQAILHNKFSRVI